jgi:uncharacterized SAM-binding protein YcdF (DUF218 family)
MSTGKKPKSPRKQSSSKKPAPHAARSKPAQPRPRKSSRKRWIVRAALAASLLVLVLFVWAVLARRFAPVANTDRTRFDTLVVLGTPANDDGNPTPAQLARVNEAVREYERGVAPHIVFTGEAAHNRFVEAEVMARAAEAQGVPASAIVLEGQAMDTIQNACYSVRIMKARGWNSAEIISTPGHLPRAAMIFNRLPIEYRVHPAAPLEPQSPRVQKLGEAIEILKTVRFLTWARLTERCEP